MKTLTITWKHYDKDGGTCERCGKTGANIRQGISELRPLLKTKDIRLVYREEKLAANDISESNTILIDGIALERFVPHFDVRYTSCDSCSCMAGQDVACRGVRHNGRVYEEVPKEVLIEAIRQYIEGFL